jgi:hypothetical protein
MKVAGETRRLLRGEIMKYMASSLKRQQEQQSDVPMQGPTVTRARGDFRRAHQLVSGKEGTTEHSRER